MIRKIILFLSFAVVLPAVIYAETYWGGELPDISNTELTAVVTLNDDIFIYNYTISSGLTNTGKIWRFRIDIKKPPEGAELSGEGLVNGPGYLKYTAAQILSEPTTPLMVPVGLFSPSNWHSGPDILGQTGWGADDDQYMILPNQSLNSFRIDSRGLPGLRNFKIEPDLIPPSEESDITPTVINEIRDKVAFKGKTLGPTAPPADFKPLEFLDYIIALKHEAFSLGWITNKGIENSLDAKLDSAKKKLEQDNATAAKNILNAFIKEVEAQGCKSSDNCPKGKHLTSEAYALLKYNVQYLIEHL